MAFLIVVIIESYLFLFAGGLIVEFIYVCLWWV